jgi:small subunit ribosomal protein S21
MAIKINIDKSDSIDKVLRRFKKMCEKEGLIKEIKRKQYYEKPSQQKRREYLKRKRRHVKLVTMIKKGIKRKKHGMMNSNN